MNNFEKSFSFLAIIFSLTFITAIAFSPDLRQLDRLLPISLLGFAANIGLLFVVLRDIFIRPFSNQNTKFLWLGLVLMLWPSIPVYLLRHGFKPRLNVSQKQVKPSSQG